MNRACVAGLLFVMCAALPAFAQSVYTPAAHDTTRATTEQHPDSSLNITHTPVNFGIITRENYIRRHAFSLDHYLEFQPGGLVARLGPIGNDAFYSRWGIGRGRALVVVNGIPLNDPQDGVAPFAHFATSGLAALTFDPPGADAYAPGIEGALALRDLDAPPARPNTFVELSKGTNQVRQRRVRFASEAGPVGLDLTYDEVLDDGYDFDANDVIPGTYASGRVRTRGAALVVRGTMPDAGSYSIGLRRFTSSSSGDLQSPEHEMDRDGHLAWGTIGIGTAQATVYGRGYRSTNPDSATANESVGGLVAWNLHHRGAALRAFVLGEHTNATEDVGVGKGRSRVNRMNAGLDAEGGTGGTTWFAHAVAGADEQSNAWGGGGGVRRTLPAGDVTLSARRSFRLPSIGERYLPSHERDGIILAGNAALDPETAWEADADWTLRARGVTNRVRASWIRSQDYISFAPVAGDSLARTSANAAGHPAMTFLEERLGVTGMVGAVEVRADAGATYSTGDREGAFQSVPRTQVNASLLCGMELFQKSSALYLGGEYAYVDDRRDYNGIPLSAYNVVNLSLVGRLVDARFYVRWLNLLDERYQTVSGYLMTPRTLAYGLEWTLFN